MDGFMSLAACDTRGHIYYSVHARIHFYVCVAHVTTRCRWTYIASKDQHGERDAPQIHQVFNPEWPVQCRAATSEKGEECGHVTDM